MAAKNSNVAEVGRGREAAGVALIALTLLLLASLISYNPLDPSPGNAVAARGPVTNWIGPVGAWLAGVLYGVLGLAGWWLTGICGWLGGRLFSRDWSGPSQAAIFGVAILVPASAGLLALFWPKMELGGEAIATGGWLGAILAGLLEQMFRELGAAVVLISLTLVGLILSASLSLAAAAEAMTSRGGSFISRMLTARVRIKERKTKQASPQIQRLKKTIENTRQHVEISIPEPPPPPKPIQTEFNFMAGDENYQPPQLDLLDDASVDYQPPDPQVLKASSQTLEAKLFDFGVEGQVESVHPGPVITMYEFAPAPGVKISKIANLADDLALALRASAVRIVAPLPGTGCVGIEIPNAKREIVFLKEMLVWDNYRAAKKGLPIVLGKDIVGRPVIADLATMPHLLIAGATGAGKSVCVNAILMSILYKFGPADVRLIMVDPKRIELKMYDGIPHLLHPVLINPKKATKALQWAVSEMDRRYDMLARASAKSIDTFNAKRAKLPPEVVDGGGTKEPLPEKLPYVVIVIDELADLMMVSSRQVEESITRLAQMARAAGIHLVLATQRPSVDVLTGIIKANFPTRIAFQVASKIDSRTIIDSNGAENLLGKGDMLFMPPGVGKLTRVHGAFVSEGEVKQVTDFLKKQGRPDYSEDITEPPAPVAGAPGGEDEEVDELYQDAVRVVLESGKVSISMVQRALRVGYNRAARMVERMAMDGIISEPDHTNNRKVLATPADLPSGGGDDEENE